MQPAEEGEEMTGSVQDTCMVKPKELVILEVTNQFSKVAGYKINLQKSVGGSIH